MNHKYLFITTMLFFLVGGIQPTVSYADESNWKMGRIYYRMVCTKCHKETIGKSISPSDYSKEEWSVYIMADKHAKASESFKHYVSTEYRDSIKATSKIVRNKKFSAKTTEQLLADIRAYVIHGAKDSATPMRCN